MKNPFSLENKTILVTGASSGIGRAIAIECSNMGATLIISARDEARLNDTFAQLSGKERAHQCIIADLLNMEEMNGLLSKIVKIDGLVLCAGRGVTLPYQFASREKFDGKKFNKMASVVILASLGGTRIFSGGNSIYGASKAALNSIMKFCAKEFASRKVRVNSICPGMVDTPMVHRGTISEEQLKEDMERYPLKRYGLPEDVAYSAVYLLSDASSWITGIDLIVDGGISIK